MFPQYFVILLRIFVGRLPSNFFSEQKKMLKRSSSPLVSSGVLHSFAQKHHTMHIRESVTGSRFHQNSIHQFKRYTIACFWEEKTMKKEVFFHKLN